MEFTSLSAYTQDLKCRTETVPNDWNASPPRFVEESGRTRWLAARKVFVGSRPEVIGDWDKVGPKKNGPWRDFCGWAFQNLGFLRFAWRRSHDPPLEWFVP